MQVVIDLEKEKVEDLKKAIELLQQVLQNKEKGLYFATGLERFSINNPRANLEKLPPQAQKMLEQEKMMAEMDISKILSRKYKRVF